MKALRSLLIGSAALIAASAPASATDPTVLVSIKPIHSLVAGVMQGIGEPALLVDGAASPHTYSLKPSQARELQNADLVFWIGREMEAFLEKPLASLASNAATVELLDAEGLTLLKFREGGAFETHDHEESGHDEHEHEHKGHEHEDHDDHEAHDEDHEAHHDEREEHAHDDHADEGEHKDAHEDDHQHGEFNPHIWLDPQNAKVLVHAIEAALAKADPENAVKYEANAEALDAQLDDLIAEVETMLVPVREKPFIVFHDAYQNFESRFGLNAAGSITVSPDVIPGAARVAEIRHKIEDSGATCVFAEPQFEPKLISVVTEGTGARAGTLDPLGAGIENGPDLYVTLIRQMAESLRECLTRGN